MNRSGSHCGNNNVVARRPPLGGKLGRHRASWYPFEVLERTCLRLPGVHAHPKREIAFLSSCRYGPSLYRQVGTCGVRSSCLVTGLEEEKGNWRQRVVKEDQM